MVQPSPPVAVVTGAARGLGAAFAVALRHCGYLVESSDRQPGGGAVVDVTDPHAVQHWIADVLDRHGRIDVAVANAGVARRTEPLDPWERAIADYDEVVGVNLGGAFWLGRAVAPAMVQQGDGHIVVISTDHVLPPPGRPTGGGAHMDLYDAAKWGLRGLVEAWARSLRRRGVRVNALCIGATDTPMLREFLAAEGIEVTDELVSGWLRPADVAEVLVALLAEGPEADGGRTGAHLGIYPGAPLPLLTAESSPPAGPVTVAPDG